MPSQNVCSPKPRKWNLPLTYAPKIEAVKAGTCTQTIRVIGEAGPKCVGDLISLHGWKGRPYHSSWSWRMPYHPITCVRDITILEKGIVATFHGDETPLEDGTYCTCKLWLWEELDWLASLDGIVPPTGEALRDVLISKNGKIPLGGIEAQIIRWDPSPLKEATHV